MDAILIDGKNYCYRHAWTRRMLRASNGFPTGAIYGVLSGMMRLNRYYPNAAMIFCWDGENTNKSWRHKLAKSYKERRRSKSGEKPQEVQDIYMQIPQLKKLLTLMGYLQIEIPKFEADDLIGVVSRVLSKKVENVYIYSSDKDFFQLISPRVHLIRDLPKDKRKNCAPITVEEIKAEYGVEPAEWVNYRSFVGDPTDDIHKPIKGLGPKTAQKLLAMGNDPSSEKGCVDRKISNCWSSVMLNYKLVKIVSSLDDKRLPSKIRRRLEKIVKILKKQKSEKLFRSKQGKSKKSYRALIALLGKYELATLLESRHMLFRLP